LILNQNLLCRWRWWLMVPW